MGLVPQQATPVFSAKLRVASLAILEALTAAVGAPRFTFLRTRAMLLVATVCLQRGKQLGETKPESIMRFPDDRGLLFNYYVRFPPYPPDPLLVGANFSLVL